MHQAFPRTDCQIPGLGMYCEHEPANPLIGSGSASALVDEHFSVFFEREAGGEELNLSEGIHFPLKVGWMRTRITTSLQKPSGMEAKFMAIQHGYVLAALTLEEVSSRGMQLLHLNAGATPIDDPKTFICFPPIIVHRFIRSI